MKTSRISIINDMIYRCINHEMIWIYYVWYTYIYNHIYRFRLYIISQHHISLHPLVSIGIVIWLILPHPQPSVSPGLDNSGTQLLSLQREHGNGAHIHRKTLRTRPRRFLGHASKSEPLSKKGALFASKGLESCLKNLRGWIYHYIVYS